MKRRVTFVVLGLLAAGVVLFIIWLARGHNLAVLNPKGIVGREERRLMITALLLMLIVVVPVYILTFTIAWKFRAGNKKAKYSPDWDHSNLLEAVWWGIPGAIILVLAVLTWTSSHALDPYQPLDSTVKPITIQVVALDWRWLFIYPEQDMASMNLAEFPANTPITFLITADAPMNSFWIPQLGGQIYAMPGMSTELHLMADEAGSYTGSSANISGRGFANMHFTAKATSQADFDQWVRSIKQSPTKALLDQQEYTELAKPSDDSRTVSYAATEKNLYNKIVLKFALPTAQP